MKIWTKVEEPMDVRVIVPYTKKTKLLQMVVDALRIQFVQPHLVNVRGEGAYWQMFSDMWKYGEEFFVVEHDCIVWPGAINLMKGCIDPWCTLPSLCHGRIIYTTFGCVKFSKDLIKDQPDIWDKISQTEHGKTWHTLDAQFCAQMGWPDGEGKPSIHYPPVIHMNEIQWPDTISRRKMYKKIAWQSADRLGDEEPVIKVNDNIVETEEQRRSKEGIEQPLGWKEDWSKKKKI